MDGISLRTRWRARIPWRTTIAKMGGRGAETALVGVEKAALMGVAEKPGATLAAAHAAAAASAATDAGTMAAVEAPLVVGDAGPWTSTTETIMLHFSTISPPPVSALVATAAAPTTATAL